MLSTALLYSTVVSALFPKYPEIVRFADEAVATTQEGRATEKLAGWTGFLVNDRKLPETTRKSYPELERMLQSVVCLHVLLQGVDAENKLNREAYDYWVQQHPAADRLPEAEFISLAMLARGVCADNATREAIEACLIYSDLGKTPKTQELAQATRIKLADHDDLMKYVLAQDNHSIVKIIPSFARLAPAVQDAIRNVYDAVPLHWPHVSHLEGGAQMFTALLASRNFSRAALEQSYLINICDIAGAAAHVDFRGAVAFNRITSIRYQVVFNAIENLLVNKDAAQTLHLLTETIGKRFGFALPLSPNDAILTRMGAFLRFTSQDEGNLLKQASVIFSVADWELMQLMFGNFTGINTWQRNPTYMPAVLLNVFNFKYPAEEDPNSRYRNALAAGLWLAKYCVVSEGTASYAAEPISFNNIAGLAKQNPREFLQLDPIVKATEDAESEKKDKMGSTAAAEARQQSLLVSYTKTTEQQDKLQQLAKLQLHGQEPKALAANTKDALSPI